MNEDERNYHIYRIMSGYTIVEIEDSIYILDTASSIVMNEAYFYYNKALRQNKFSEMFDLDLARVFLIKEKIWDINGDSNLEEIEKSLDNAKLQLYHAYFLNEKAINDARRRIKLIRAKREETLNKKHLIDDNTVQGLANIIKENHIISRIILNENYEPMKIDDGILLNKINTEYNKVCLDHVGYRLIARSDEWRSIWNTQGIEAFRKIGLEQTVLATYSRLYDNISQHSECPPKAMIEDDDMLDGWLIYISQEKEQDKNTSTTNRYFGDKYKKADEIFIPVQTPADINKVLAMNSTQAKIIQQQIHNVVDKQGIATDLQIPEKVRANLSKGK